MEAPFSKWRGLYKATRTMSERTLLEVCCLASDAAVVGACWGFVPFDNWCCLASDVAFSLDAAHYNGGVLLGKWCSCCWCMFGIGAVWQVVWHSHRMQRTIWRYCLASGGILTGCSEQEWRCCLAGGAAVSGACWDWEGSAFLCLCSLSSLADAFKSMPCTHAAKQGWLVL
eukprot:scaffold29416_cov20-Tisochrysis_lutea.AAC.2